MKHVGFADIGEHLIITNWGRKAQFKTTEDAAISVCGGGEATQDEIMCYLAYIARMIKPISELCVITLEKKRQEERREYQLKIDQRKEKNRTEYKKEYEYYEEIRTKYGAIDGFRLVLYSWYCFFQGWLKHPPSGITLLQKPITEWTVKDVRRLRGIGAVRAKRFMDWQNSIIPEMR